MKELTLTAIEEIDALAKEYAQARDTLSVRVQTLQDELAAAHRRYIKGIKAAAAEAALRKTMLEQALAAHPDLFVKPRTMVLHGIKVGFAKGKGEREPQQRRPRAARRRHAQKARRHDHQHRRPGRGQVRHRPGRQTRRQDPRGDLGGRMITGSAIQRAASAAAARIVHHSRWPARADEAHALASKIILGEMRRVICTAVDHECTCGGNPPESLAACPACLVWHRIYSSPNGKVSDGD